MLLGGSLLMRPAPRISARALVFALGVSCAALIGAPLQAQSDLAGQRQAVFDLMFEDPTNRDLMMEYARLSAQMGDFETVAATLERLIALEPGNAEARLALAQAYTAIGAVPLSNYHLGVLSQSPNAAPETAARSAAIQQANADQTNPNRLSGRVIAGASWQGESGTSGFTGSVQLDWRLRLSGAHAPDWRTQIGATAFAAGDGGTADRQLIRLRTGPEFRITGETQGPRLQPYLQLEASRDDDGNDLNQIGLGLFYLNAFSDRWGGFADLSLARADNLTTDEDVTLANLSLGALYRATSNTALRFALTFENQDGSIEDRRSRGARVNLTHSFDAPFGNAPQDWVLSGFAIAQRIDVTGGTSPRDDTLYGLGAGLRVFLSDDLFLDTQIARSLRDSTLAGFDTSETTLSLSLGWEF